MFENVKITPLRIRVAVFLAVILVSFIFGWTIRGCGDNKESAQERIEKHDATALPAGFIVKDMNGVDLSGLDDQHRIIALDLLNRIPCMASAGGISVARCRRDAPSCVTSQRMADFIVDKVRKGFSEQQILISLYDKALGEDHLKPRISDTAANLPLEGLPWTGARDAGVTVVLLFDYTSAISRKALQTAEQLQALYPKQVKIVYWPWPRTRLRPASERAAEIAIAASFLGGFDKIHPLLVRNEGRSGDTELNEYAEKSAMPSLIDETNSEKVIKKLESLENAIKNLGIDYPPVFFVQGRRITGPAPGVCFLMDAVQAAMSKSVQSEYRNLEERIAP